MSLEAMEPEEFPVEEPTSPQTSSQSLWETGDDNQKWLNISYVAGALLLTLVAGYGFETVVKFVFDRFFYDSALGLQIERLPVSPGFIMSGALAVFLGFYTRRQTAWNGFGLEVVAELKKVTWPPMDITWKSTLAVIMTVFFFAILLAIYDSVWRSLVGWVVN